MCTCVFSFLEVWFFGSWGWNLLDGMFTEPVPLVYIYTTFHAFLAICIVLLEMKTIDLLLYSCCSVGIDTNALKKYSIWNQNHEKMRKSMLLDRIKRHPDTCNMLDMRLLANRY